MTATVPNSVPTPRRRAEPFEVTTDGRLLIATRGVRGFVDGAVAVTLSAFLTGIGYSGARIGVIVTGMLLGSAALTLAVGTAASALRRRTVLLVGTTLMVATGATFATTSAFWLLFAMGVIGTMNPSSGDVSVFQPVEQALLPLTVSTAQRSRLFARYTFTGSLCAAAGSLAAGLPDALHISVRWVFAVYALGGFVAVLLYRRLSAAMEPTGAAAPAPLGDSRAVVYRLAALFSLDAFGGGFVVQSLLALWLFRRFDFTLANAGAVLAAMGVLSAASGFAAVRIERSIGPIRTMVFTHMPAQLLLIAAALMPSPRLAVVCLLGRSLLSSMDVPVRNAYVMSVVSPAERAAAASVTNVPRSLASALPPFAAGWMLDHSTFGWPLIIAGGLKITYDILLLLQFGRTPIPSGD